MDNNQAQSNLEALYSISQIASSAEDLPNLWGPLLDEVLTALKVDAGSLMILEGDFLVRKAARGLSDILKEPPIPSASGGISWRVVKSRRPAVITNLKAEKVASQVVQGNFHSLIAMPMMIHDQVIGVMSVFTYEERQFSQTDLNFFGAITNQAALAVISIQSANLLRENRDRLAELEALNQISQSITTLFDFEGTLYSILVAIVKMFRGDIGLVALFNHENYLLCGESPAFGLNSQQISDFRVRNDEGVMGQAFCKGIPVMENKIDPETSAVLKRAKINGIKSILVAPLRVKSQTLGVIQIFSQRENNFNSTDLRLVSILASQAAIIVNSSTMYRQIEEERKKDEALLTSIGDGVLAIDKTQKIIRFNKSGEEITGFLREELFSKYFEETLGLFNKEKKLVSAKDSLLSKVLKTGEPIVSKEYFLRKRSGALFPVYLSVAAVYDVGDKIVGAIVTFRDITSEIEVEQIKEELISLSTHELRAPITAIKGYLDMILEGDTGGVSGETKETIEEVVVINQRLADLVDDLLNVNRIEQGRVKINFEAVDLSMLITQTVREYQSQAHKKNLIINFDDKAIPEVKADSKRLRQVLNNLISNAIKYTKQGSIDVSCQKNENEIIGQVKDTGIGISKADQKRLFEKFYRVRNPETIEITGTGLGLWITRKLLEMMNGKIWLESEEGKGTTFYFSLPVYSNHHMSMK
ncbi:MAG: GAF sensor signal transduction histidine kinase [Berkelbacteria bacterium GW2011_GWA1_36_9]|uniref:histidine kinase n=1 Tax=Berkelbacteria bacterium GW2011_GWA1_36_9 TaxID=1618331 RepID=A0A0G0FHR2_9BACT|nr:MAG: GAF sensor signal transduction histidine kinase [Berkelbacteria bacterium GW2011_GWA1_36_9]